jgi:alpha/beta superfamily hydrolase
MDSGVVTAAAEACAGRGLATLRFNFRGVGASTGKHDDGRGEQDDVRAAAAEVRRRLPAGAPVALVGYSFGAAVAAAVAERTPIAGLALIAPPLRLASFQPPAAVTGPILVVVGAEDQYCPPAALETIRDTLPQATITVLEGADHFFFGALDQLAEAVGGWAAAVAG